MWECNVCGKQYRAYRDAAMCHPDVVELPVKRIRIERGNPLVFEVGGLTPAGGDKARGGTN
jgi:hypothetical protein